MAALPEAVEAARVTGHARYLTLGDPDSPEFRPDYLPLMRQIAAGEPPSPPPLLTRLKNFTGAVVSHVAAGMPAADEATVAGRLAVCGGCDQRLPGGACAGCGCNLSLKASWLDQDCPKGKWPAPPGTPGAC